MPAETDYRVNAVNPQHATSGITPSPKRKNRPGKRKLRPGKRRSDQDADDMNVDENIEDQNDEKRQDDHTVDYYA